MWPNECDTFVVPKKLWSIFISDGDFNWGKKRRTYVAPSHSLKLIRLKPMTLSFTRMFCRPLFSMLTGVWVWHISARSGAGVRGVWRHRRADTLTAACEKLQVSCRVGSGGHLGAGGWGGGVPLCHCPANQAWEKTMSRCVKRSLISDTL